ncbi:MAG: serine/threonine protein kinase [Chloroflexi bacterium]|nr:serine/threonine protein kinase [Chloroflexota bacterium]
MDALIGQRLGQYEIIAKLGVGGMATVYRARQASMDRDVAVKVIRADLMEDENLVARFRNEARLIASLQHLHILKVFDYGNQDNILYLVMELLEGGSLGRLLRQSGSLPLKLAVRMLDQISAALDYAHGRGIIHRDLKPDNVLLDQQQNAFLTDFGIAKMLGDTLNRTRTGMVMGTPAYMAPELWHGQAADARTDVYALGVMLYEMLTGVSPFRAETPYQIMHRHIYEPPPSLRSQGVALPAAVDHVIGRALAKNPNERFFSAGELAAAFREALEGYALSQTPQRTADSTPVDTYVAPTAPPSLPEFSTPSSSQLTKPRPAERKRGNNALVLMIGLLVVVIVGVGIFAAFNANQAALVERQGALDLTVTAQAIARQATAALNLQFVIVPSATDTPSATPFPTLTHVLGATSTLGIPSVTETLSITPSLTLTASPTHTLTSTHTPSATPSPTPTPTFTPSPTDTPSATPSPTHTHTPTTDPATLVAATLAPIQTQTAFARQLQQTVDAVLAAERATADAQATQLAQQRTLTASALFAQQTLSALNTLQAIQSATRTPTHTATHTSAAFASPTAAVVIITPISPIFLTSIPFMPFVPSLDTPMPLFILPTPPPIVFPATATPITCPGFLPSRLVIGEYGRLTPGDPNRLRETPNGRILALIRAGETFKILDGPICDVAKDGSGLAWWKVEYVSPRNGRTYIGWTAEGSGSTYWIDPVSHP